MMERLQVRPISANPTGDRPRITSSTYIDSAARIIGNVEIGPRSFVGPCAVIRSDEVDETGKVAPISIGEECNVQDSVILHSLAGQQISIGARVSLAHGCIIHGPCAIGNNSFIGFRAVVFKATVGAGSYIGTGAIVEGVGLPPRSRVPAGTVVNTP
jgi:carbonic anhydrase/acetyltransferase-like protein (isoleucine patch superfamily)